jgi:hypothetical protein
MSQITKILDSIFQNNGGTTKQWREANTILLTKTDEVKKYVAYIKNKIRDLNKDIQLLSLDFLDYSIDDGKMPLWTQVGSKDFLTSLVNIYKTRSEEEVQSKILYLIKKWANKFQKYNTIIPYFSSTYENLKNNDVIFPKDIDSTYEKYLQGSEVNSGFGGEESKKPKDEKDISKNKTYVKDINVDLRTTSYEKKYKRLVNKLDDWTGQIQDANVYMDLAQGGNFDDELRGICEELEAGKKQLVDTIESGKLKDENLMEISLKVQDDINSTLKRWDDVKNGRMPQPFISSFFNKKEDDNNNNMNIGNNNNNQNKGGFDLLGFGNEFGGNNNGNNNSNTGNDLLDVFSGPQNPNQGNNDFFGNLGNNNQNNNLFGNNNNQNNQNNNFFGNNNQNNTNQNNFFGNNNINQNNNNNFFGNNNSQSTNPNQNNFFGNNIQSNINQNNNTNDLFSQMFNNTNNTNNTNNMSNNNFNNINNINNNNNMNINSNNNFDNLFQNNSNNNNFNNILNMNNQFMDLTKTNNNSMNQMNFGNNNNFNNSNNFINNNNPNFDYNYNKPKNNKNTSNKDYVFEF